MSEITFVVCPMCGWGRPLQKKFKPPFSFLQLNPSEAIFIDYRRAEYRSIRRIGGLTLKEAVDKGYKALVEEVAQQALKVYREAKDALGEREASEGED